MRKLRFLEISDLGDEPRRTGKIVSFDATGLDSDPDLARNYQHGLFFSVSQLLFPLLENSGQ